MVDRQCSRSWSVTRAHVQCDTHHRCALYQGANTHRPNNKDNNRAVFAVVRSAREYTNDLREVKEFCTDIYELSACTK